MKIKNIEQLQSHLIESIERLASGKIDVVEMGIISKACEGVITSLKTQLMYNNMRNEIPNIKFLQECNDGQSSIENNNTKQLKRASN